VVTYLIITPQTYRGTLQFFPISSVEVSKYEELNSLELITIDGEYLEKLFIEELLTYKGFEASITENRYIEKIKLVPHPKMVVG